MSTTDTVSEIDQIKHDVDELASDIDTLQTITTASGLAGFGLGALGAILFGPGALLAGGAVGGIPAIVTKVIARSRKRKISDALSLLVKSGKIPNNTAADLTSRLLRIYSDDPSLSETSCKTEGSHSVKD